jgi:hypothetical protein
VQTKGYAKIMAVMVPRETVTEHRLDALEKKVDEGFAEVGDRFKQVDERFNRLEDRFDAKFDALNRTLIGSAVAVIVALIGSSATLAGIALF